MKTIYVKLLFVLTLMILIGNLKYRVKLIDFVLHNPIVRNDIVKVKMNKETLEIPIDEYLIGVIAGEMPASFELEALKAQAVASRTFVLSRNLNVDNTTSTQVYLTDEQMKKNWGSQYQTNLKKIKKLLMKQKMKS